MASIEDILFPSKKSIISCDRKTNHFKGAHGGKNKKLSLILMA
ncbi:hypothetical protein [Avibacterium paragallinarum]|nr:hypothetical protein [Avibacterium paragallinarum]